MTRPVLDRALVLRAPATTATLPTRAQLELPERAVQFGTGGLLRGLVDAVIDDANRAGRFNGRVAAIATTASGRDTRINRQDGLFTLVVQGVEAGAEVRQCVVVGSVSRAISATEEWARVLECARNPLLDVVFSNTTEIGITLDENDARRVPDGAPASFPAKLTMFLYERARAFGFAPAKGVVVVPCELIDRNGDALRTVALTLAGRWSLPAEFERWLRDSVLFCNTLVDRIVTGMPDEAGYGALSDSLGFDDGLMTACEPYRLLAIEGDTSLRDRLPFARPEAGVVIADDISPYLLRKVRLLNGGHTAIVSLALLAGCNTVKEALDHRQLGPFLRTALRDEIVPHVGAPGAAQFAADVLDRFANPHIRHQLRDIALHGGAKMRVRVVPSIAAYATHAGEAPRCLTLGFAAYLLLARGANAELVGDLPDDDMRSDLRERWESVRGEPAVLPFVRSICGDATLWGADLDVLPDVSARVAAHLTRLMRDGATAALSALQVSPRDAVPA